MSKDQEAEVVLRLDRISKTFGALKANDAVSLTLRRGEVVALLGENGAGKTTLMNILFGHYVADEGSVEVFGAALPPGNPRAALAAGVVAASALSSLLWLPALLHRNELAVMGTAWLVLAMAATAAIGVLVFGESLNRFQIAGLALAAAALVLLSRS